MSDDLCECPKCGRMHRNLGFGKPPEQRRPVWLRREGDHAIVAIEVDGKWQEVIRERYDGNFSHIWEDQPPVSVVLS